MQTVRSVRWLHCRTPAASCGRALQRAIASVALAAAVTVHAQSAPLPPTREDSVPSCMRFTFGTWTPALNWNEAGHFGSIDTARVARTAEGRAWAARSGMSNSDSVLVLYPTFWPAGVAIAFDPKVLAHGDTVVARAVAFVADARKPSPVTQARIWSVPCRRE